MSIDKFSNGSDDKLNEKYRETFDEIRLPEKTERFILGLPQRRENIMYKKRTLNVLVCAIVLALGVTAYAAVMASRTDSEPVPASLSHSYSDLRDYQKKIGLEFPCPQEAALGYKFFNMNINDDADYDEEGNVIGEYGSFYASYFKDNYALTYKVCPSKEYASQKLMFELENGAASQIHKTDSMTYYYTVSETDPGAGDSMKEETVTWWSGDNFYQISGYDLPLSVDDWFTLADSFTD